MNAVHVGYRKGTVTSNKLMKNDYTNAYFGKLPADLCAGSHLICNYLNIIENQYVGDAKVQLPRVIDSKQRLKTGTVCELEPTYRIAFFKF